MDSTTFASNRIVELDSSSSDEADNFVESQDEENEANFVVLEAAAVQAFKEPSTRTLEEQNETEDSIRVYLDTYRLSMETAGEEKAELVQNHSLFLSKGLNGVSRGYQGLDASRPWMVYWILHALELLNALPDQEMQSRVLEFLRRCHNASGGFGGGPGQLSHLAPTYAAVNAIAIIGTPEAYAIADRRSLHAWLLTLKDPVTGGFRMHRDGEVDVRGTYCAMSVARLLNILTPQLMERAPEFVAQCQTYEGGMGGEPGNEAHGGYAFCALAAMVIMKKTYLLNIQNLTKWAVDRQMAIEGGFQGRTNKLVDSCYSFWMGGIFPLLDRVVFNPDKYDSEGNILPDFNVASAESDGRDPRHEGGWMFDQRALQRYLLICCQDGRGGLRDKPGKSADYYHTCYALSGLSVAEFNPEHFAGPAQTIFSGKAVVFKTDSIHNIGPESVRKIRQHFASLTLDL